MILYLTEPNYEAMNTRYLFFLIVSLLLSCKPTTNPAKEEWISLFNGKDFQGWDIKIAGHELNENFANTFQVKDSLLKIDYNGYQKFTKEFGHIYYQQPFSYYRVRLAYRFTGQQLTGGPDYANLNSGIMLHSQAANTLDKDQQFPVSLEMQFLASEKELQRPTGNLCTPGTEIVMKGELIKQHCIDSDSKHYGKDNWILAEAIVLGDSVIHHIIEGDTVLTYHQPQFSSHFVNPSLGWAYFGFADSLSWIQKQGTPLRKGYIALQAESHPIEFKRIELLNLKGCTDPKALNYKSYYVKSDNAQCRYK
jgi:Domain of Unknown Function (DUF1080)